MPNLKRRTVSAIIWSVIGSIANKGSGFIISIFLARILNPEDFGLLGMVMVFVTISSVLMDVGLGSALIQRNNLKPQDYSTVLIINACLGIVLSYAMFVGSNALGRFYDNDRVPEIAQFISWIFLINSLGIVPKSKLTKELKFKLLAQISVVSSIVSGIVGIIMALNGFGVWSLVFLTMLSACLNMLFLWLVVNWFPGIKFSRTSFNNLWGYGFNIFISSVINRVVLRIDLVLIGKLFSPALLGYYTRAKSVTNLIENYAGSSISKVLFPAFSTIQNRKEKLKEVYIKSLRISSLLSFSLAGLLYAIASPLVILVFTDKWSASIPFLQLMLLKSFVIPLSALSLSVIKGTGKSRHFLYAEIFKKSLYLLTVVVGFRYGVIEFLYGLVFQGILSLVINYYYVDKTINVSVLHHFKIMIPIALCAIAGASVLLVYDYFFEFSSWLDIFTGVVVFMGIFVGSIKFSGNKAYPIIQEEVSAFYLERKNRK